MVALDGGGPDRRALRWPAGELVETLEVRPRFGVGRAETRGGARGDRGGSFYVVFWLRSGGMVAGDGARVRTAMAKLAEEKEAETEEGAEENRSARS